MTVHSVREISPDEMPDSVRTLPRQLDPLASGVLMAPQQRYLELTARHRLSVIEKGRRTGITFARALNDTITAATRRSAGGDNIWYVADTREKGLEFVGYCAHMARVIAAAAGASAPEEAVWEHDTESITIYRIRFASGFRITALPSRPAVIRGLQGIVIIDEAAFHPDVRGVIAAANALLIWGGAVHIISTHNGTDSAFNELVNDARAGRYPHKVVRVTFTDAVDAGLYERVCLIRDWEPSPAGKRAWEAEIRASYGTDTAAMREELDCIPRSPADAFLALAMLARAADPDVPVVRLALDDAFLAAPESHRRSEIRRWCATHLDAHLGALRRDGRRDDRHAAGVDWGRSGDLTVIWLLARTPAGSEPTRLVVELRNVPFDAQYWICCHVLDGAPRLVGGALDARGLGAQLSEGLWLRYGRSRFERVMLSEGWYRDHTPHWKAMMEDRTRTLPDDPDVVADHRLWRVVGGVARIPAGASTQGADGGRRHGDAAEAHLLADYAMHRAPAPIEFEAEPETPWDAAADHRRRYRTVARARHRPDPLRDAPDLQRDGLW